MIAAVANGLHWPRHTLQEFRERMLRDLLREAAHVPLYRHALRSFDDSGTASSPFERLARLPIIDRPTVQAAPLAYRLRPGIRERQLEWVRTTGSTGHPLRIGRTRAEAALLAAFRVRVLMNLGFRPTDLRVSIALDTLRVAHHQSMLARVGLFRRTTFDAEYTPEQVIVALRRLKPHVLTGHCSSIARVAAYATAADRHLLPLRFITCGAEALFPQVRSEISTAFGARVINNYGAHEANLLASECPHTGYLHVLDHSLVLEVLQDGRPVGVGEEGEVVITPLHSRAMPFLRYKLGDLAVRGPEPCPCGHPSSTLLSIRGRTNDAFQTREGVLLHPYVVADALLDRVDWVKRFQIVEAEPARLRIRVIPTRTVPPAELAALELAIAQHLSGRVSIELELTAELPTGLGKFKHFVPFRNVPGETTKEA